MRRREFVQMAAFGAAALGFGGVRAWKALAQEPENLGADQLHFLVMGDWGSGDKLQREVAAAMRTYVQKSRPVHPIDFLITTGDNFYDNGVTGIEDPQWFSKFEEIYPATDFPHPIFAVLGNHDWRGNPAAQIAYSSTPGTRWQMDGFYYKRSFGGEKQTPLADIFFIDTNLWLPQHYVKGLGDRQTKWLDNALATSKARWRFIVGHHPPFSDGAHGHDADLVIIREVLLPLCNKHGVHAVLSGHDHDLQRIEVEGHNTIFLVSGAAGAVLRDRKFNDHVDNNRYIQGTGGFLTMQLTRNNMNGQFWNTKGEVLDKWSRKIS